MKTSLTGSTYSLEAAAGFSQTLRDIKFYTRGRNLRSKIKLKSNFIPVEEIYHLKFLRGLKLVYDNQIAKLDILI
jgi:hypothetical protein